MKERIEPKDSIKNLSFEDALEGLERSASALERGDTTLEEAMSNFADGMNYYERCAELLREAKQSIQLFDKANGELTDF